MNIRMIWSNKFYTFFGYTFDRTGARRCRHNQFRYIQTNNRNLSQERILYRSFDRHGNFYFFWLLYPCLPTRNEVTFLFFYLSFIIIIIIIIIFVVFNFVVGDCCLYICVRIETNWFSLLSTIRETELNCCLCLW